MTTQLERRQFPRADLDWPVVIETNQRYIDGRTMDISAGGAFICCREALKPHEEFRMAVFDIPLVKRHLPIRAEVLRSGIYCLERGLRSHGIGVMFAEISNEDREVIANLVSDHLQSTGMDGKVEKLD